MKQQVKFKLVEIPDKALKECLVNSMAHRDYNEKGANIQIDYSLGLTPQLAAFGSFIWKHS